MATYYVANTLSEIEEIGVDYSRDLTNVPYSKGVAAYNPGSQTGPKKSNYKFNAIAVPLPRTNLQVEVEPCEEITLTTTDMIEEEFIKALDITGIKVGTTTFKTATLTYDVNGGTGDVPAAVAYVPGKAIVLPTCAATKDSKAFDGWALTAAGDVAYKAGDQYVVSATATLYAHYATA